jgi:predicted PhzF superfamily epimerase YddE/YHI9
VTPPVQLTIHQGDDMGRPSLLTVDVPAEPGSGIAVSGTAVPLPG